MLAINEVDIKKGKRVLVRVDFNVPTDGNRVIDDTRIKDAQKTIDYLSKLGARVVLISHFKKGESLASVADTLDSIRFIKTLDFEKINEEVFNMQDGEVVLLENLRLNEGEEKNDETFVKHLVKLGDVFIFEAFSVSHRKHASVIGVPKYLPTYIGFHMKQEVEILDKIVEPKQPSLFILGGAKLDTKLGYLDKAVEKFSNILVCGAVANVFLEQRGFGIGNSLTTNLSIKEDVLLSDKVIVPEYYTVNRNGDSIVVNVSEIKGGDKIVDVHPKSFDKLNELGSFETILWNGSVGMEEFNSGKVALYKYISASKAYSVVGGGDTIAGLRDSEKNSFSHVSSAGGAALNYVLTGTTELYKALK